MTHTMTVLVFQLALIVVVSRLGGIFVSRVLKGPRVLGELASGMLIGPFALGSLHIPFLHGPLFPLPPGTVPVSPELYGFAMVASIVLLFMSGLETDLPTFLRFSAKGSVVGLGGVAASFILGDLTAVLLLPEVDTFLHPTALFLGTLSTATSVGITARILSERRQMSSPEGVTILAAAVLDDVLGIVLLAVVVGVSKISRGGGNVPWSDIGLIAAKAFGFWIICTVLGIFLAPRLTRGLKRFKSMETVAGISFGIALLLAGFSETVGLAMIIGAYVTGLSLSQTDVAHEIKERLEGVYQFFIPVFFCVMGMMVDFSALPGVAVFGLIFAAAAVAGKLFGCGIPALFSGFNLRGALRIAAGMLPRGEVTLIVAGVGLSSGAIGSDMFGVAIMTLLVASIIAPPVLVKSFNGGSGYRKKVREKQAAGRMTTIDLEFPRAELADFIRGRVLSAFRNEEFFIQHVDYSRPIYHIRKDKILISLMQTDNRIAVTTPEENELFVRLLMLEEILGLKDFLTGLESMKSPDMMGAELMMGMFAAEKKTSDGEG
ncbi:MAG: cation:proton antiporter [Spirochaetales bacterium]|nr:cation:proton antiporter [Spirochaetales bacterium]